MRRYVALDANNRQHISRRERKMARYVREQHTDRQ